MEGQYQEQPQKLASPPPICLESPTTRTHGYSTLQDTRPIGIFDSGVGGLTVLEKINEVLPNESIVYIGDTANAPYGGKSPESLLKHARDIIKFLRTKNVKAIVLACGTTSSTVYEQLTHENPDIPMVDVIRPGAMACIEMAAMSNASDSALQSCTIQHSSKPQDNKKPLRLGLIATAATIKSGLFAHIIKSHNPNIQILTQACPLFAPMVEAGVTDNHIAKWAAEAYIGHWRGKIDALVLGCTHYPLMTNTLSSILGQDIQYINLATHTAQALKAKLAITTHKMTDITVQGATAQSISFYVSGEPDSFNKTAGCLLGKSLNAEKIKL